MLTLQTMLEILTHVQIHRNVGHVILSLCDSRHFTDICFTCIITDEVITPYTITSNKE